MSELSLADRVQEVRSRIADACARARRDPSQVTLVAVTKNAAPEQIREILRLGIGDLGESRVQVLAQRTGQINEFYNRQVAHGDTRMPRKLRWHMIGHLQRNKVKSVLPMVSLIHSVDSLRLAEEIEVHAARLDHPVPILLEVNTSEEKSKFGVAVGAADHLAEQIMTMKQIRLVGLMAMAPLEGGLDTARRAFVRARELFEEMRWNKIGGDSFNHLSMGMSNDFELAIEEGATLVRIGSALFGPPKSDDGQAAEGAV